MTLFSASEIAADFFLATFFGWNVWSRKGFEHSDTCLIRQKQGYSDDNLYIVNQSES